ncbi:hypothetical protein ES708_20010 [subsurface metagenome]
MIWFPLALSAALCWAVGAVLVKQGFTNVPPLWNNIVNNVLALLIWIPVVLLLSKSRINLPSIGVFITILTASILFQFFYYSLSRGLPKQEASPAHQWSILATVGFSGSLLPWNRRFPVKILNQPDRLIFPHFLSLPVCAETLFGDPVLRDAAEADDAVFHLFHIPAVPFRNWVFTILFAHDRGFNNCFPKFPDHQLYSQLILGQSSTGLPVGI